MEAIPLRDLSAYSANCLGLSIKDFSDIFVSPISSVGPLQWCLLLKNYARFNDASNFANNIKTFLDRK